MQLIDTSKHTSDSSKGEEPIKPQFVNKAQSQHEQKNSAKSFIQ